jgi:AAHS family 4-hydroxybenzoate transporter-like MFS transporter
VTEDSRPTLDEVINARSLSPLQIGVIALCAAVVFVDGYDIQVMALAAPSIAVEWGVPPEAFGWVLSGSLWGMLLSALVAPLGDRFGRVPVLAGCLALIGASTIATAFADSFGQLFACRVLTGVGLGACQANATAMTSEYAPARRRAALMTLMGCNVGLGALTAGLAAPAVIDAAGWRGVFWVGGAAPLALAAVFLSAAPESVRLLAALRPQDPRLARIMARIAPGQAFRVAPAPVAPGWSPALGSLADLLGRRYINATWRLWLLYACASFLLYLLMSWLPVILGGAGWSRPDALRGIAALQLGGIVGAILLSLLVDRGRAVLALLIAFTTGAVGAALFAVVPPTGLGWTPVIVLTGAGLFGPTFAIFAVAAQLYPPALRAAGFGWMAAVARGGAILGPLAGGAMLASGLEARYVAAALAAPALVCILAALTLRRVIAAPESAADVARERPSTDGASSARASNKSLGAPT